MTSRAYSPSNVVNLISFKKHARLEQTENIFHSRSFLLTFQEKYFSPKRTKPSLSIVNPLDVLRQRVMLEMARRQRENANKQVKIKCHEHLLSTLYPHKLIF